MKKVKSMQYNDEAHSLMKGSESDFGREAIETLIQAAVNSRNDSLLFFHVQKEVSLSS
ncbi:hypothetical protein GGQ84_000707 [Desulfitispora alkaliphila]|uniref:hypothetical protein n=1 Tax=Desulfitispora alkaliphila TaxID=622674 RepID=UPI003D1D158C